MATRWSESEHSDRLSATRREINAALNRTAARQKQLLRLEQLTELGLGPRGVQLRAEHGTLHRIHRSVYATHSPPYSRQQILLAATYACGPSSAISDWSASAHLGMTETAPPIAEVTSPAGTGRGVTGITVHRRPLDRRDVWRKQGIPTTTAARTIVDLCPRAGLEGTEELVMAADSKQILNRGRLERLAEERRGRPGIHHVLALITDDPVELRSINERRMFSICREAGVPLPLCNQRVKASPTRYFVADFIWPGLRLIVEAASWRWHGGRLAGERDAERDQLLAIAGWRVVHFTRDQIKYRRAETGRRLVALTRGG